MKESGKNVPRRPIWCGRWWSTSLCDDVTKPVKYRTKLLLWNTKKIEDILPSCMTWLKVTPMLCYCGRDLHSISAWCDTYITWADTWCCWLSTLTTWQIITDIGSDKEDWNRCVILCWVSWVWSVWADREISWISDSDTSTQVRITSNVFCCYRSRTNLRPKTLC